MNITEKKPNLYEKIDLISGVDEDGKFWEIRPFSEEKIYPLIVPKLRESDLLELIDWAVKELGWINKK